jgi:hypothetical protein
MLAAYKDVGRIANTLSALGNVLAGELYVIGPVL